MGFRYDMSVLAKAVGFDAVGAAAQFESETEFFDSLSAFVERSGDFLRSYNPTMIIFSDEIQQHFLEELGEIEQMARRLQMHSLMTEVGAMREAIEVKSVQEVSDGIIKFKAKVNIMIGHIAVAIRPDDPAKAFTIPEPPRKMILAVDDKPEVLSAINGALGKKYKVVSVTSAKAALDMLKRHTPALLLLGSQMAGMSGYTLAERIRENEKQRHIPVLFMTDVSAALGEGHIQLPIDRAELRKKTADMIGK